MDHPVSLWRKRNNVHHNEQNQPKWFNMTALANNDLSIKSEDLSMQSNMIWVDPPEGWKYGFPAIYDPVNDGKMRDWIVRKGYPLLTIKEYGEQWMVRTWPVEVKPSDES